MIQRITQSFIKSMRSYLAEEECGKITKAQWVDDRLIDLDSDSAELGSWFEFMLSGALPKNGIVPKPGMYASGKQMLAKYALATENAKRVKTYLDALGLKIIKVGQKVTKGRFEGTVDLIVECQKPMSFGSIKWNFDDRFVIDLKYSGLLDDKWSKHGWQWSNLQKEYHGTQAKHYHLVSGLPFYFLVCSSTNEDDIKMFHVPIDEFMLEKHIAEANHLFDALTLHNEIGWVVRPEVSKCNKCPLRGECSDKHTYPHPETVDLTIL